MKKVSSAFFFAVFAFCFHLPAADAASASISQISFTSDVQSIAVGTSSAAITIQTQNAGGTSEKLDNTSSANFTSSSPTGEFSSNASNWIPVSKLTMSKNSYNKNFYYRDSAAGDDTITVVVTEGTLGTSWTASQIIHVGTNSGSNGGNTASTTASDTATTTATSTASPDTLSGNYSATAFISSHSDPEPLSDLADEPDFSLGAGRDRITLAGTPLLFRANLKNSVRPNLSWVFGDGAVGMGLEAFHTYYFPGIYDVVLDADIGASHGTSRAKVRVVAPDFSLVLIPEGGLKIVNNSSYEANIFGWQIVSGNSHFSFPRDTIIAAHGSVIFPSAITGIPAGNPIGLFNPLSIEISSAGGPPLASASQNIPPTVVVASSSAANFSSSSTEATAVLSQADILQAGKGNSMPKDVFAAQKSLPKVSAEKKTAIAPGAAVVQDTAPATVSESFVAKQDFWQGIRNFFADIF